MPDAGAWPCFANKPDQTLLRLRPLAPSPKAGCPPILVAWPSGLPDSNRKMTKRMTRKTTKKQREKDEKSKKLSRRTAPKEIGYRAEKVKKSIKFQENSKNKKK